MRFVTQQEAVIYDAMKLDIDICQALMADKGLFISSHDLFEFGQFGLPENYLRNMTPEEIVSMAYIMKQKQIGDKDERIRTD